MDLMTALTSTVGPVVTTALRDIWNDYRRGRDIRKGTAINPEGDIQDIPVVSGAYSIPDVDIIPTPKQVPPISIVGEFSADESLADWIDIWFEEEDKEIVLLINDEETDDIYFFTFGFEGYSINIWPGEYSIYAFIVDPDLDEVLGFGYPRTPGLDDPNPFQFTGEGVLSIDVHLFDLEAFENQVQWHDTGWDLENMDESQFYNLMEAAQEGDSEAQFQLGKMFITGRFFRDGFVVQQDKQQGYQLVFLAAGQGHTKAKGYLHKKGMA